MDDVVPIAERIRLVRGWRQEGWFGSGSAPALTRLYRQREPGGAYFSKCFLATLYVYRGCSNALMTFIHLLASCNVSSSGSSSRPMLDMPKLAELSSRVSEVAGLSPSLVLEWSASSVGSSIKLF